MQDGFFRLVQLLLCILRNSLIIKEIFHVRSLIKSCHLWVFWMGLGGMFLSSACTRQAPEVVKDQVNVSLPIIWHSADRDIRWLEWGAAAFDKAKERDCPILLYLAAPGCDGIFAGTPIVVQSLAEERFISIRVDPYRRPDIAEQFFTGGWPALVLLTAGGQSFAVAVDIAPRNVELFLLRNLEHYTKNRPLIEKKIASSTVEADTAKELVTDLVYRQIQASFDQRNGGFGQDIKFPEIEVLRFLLVYAHYSGSSEAFQLVRQSLNALLGSPMVDAGGLELLSYTPDWRTPMRQKDAIDQAGFLHLLLEVEGEDQERYRTAARELLNYIEKHLYNSSLGAFQGRQVYIDKQGWWTDPQLYADRNALLISALVKAALVLEDRHAADLARTATAFLMQNGIDVTGAVLHTYGDGQIAATGLLMDQILVGHALLDMHKLDDSLILENQARKVIDYMEKTLFDPERMAFYMGPPLMPLWANAKRRFSYRDNLLPAANPAAAELLLRLKKSDRASAILTGKRLTYRLSRAYASYARVMLHFNQARQASL